MNYRNAKINKERLSGNRIFLHNLKNVSTTSTHFALRTHIIRALFFILVSTFVANVFFVVCVIFNVADKKDILSKNNNIENEISKLENKYNLYSSNITKDYALSLGFVSDFNVSFVLKKDKNVNNNIYYENEN